MISVLILTLHFFSSDFKLLSSYTFERYCSKLLILKKVDMRNFLKTSLAAKGSCKQEHSNYQRKYFSESSESMDLKSHADCNVAHFSGSKVEI